MLDVKFVESRSIGKAKDSSWKSYMDSSKPSDHVQIQRILSVLFIDERIVDSTKFLGNVKTVVSKQDGTIEFVFLGEYTEQECKSVISKLGIKPKSIENYPRYIVRSNEIEMGLYQIASHLNDLG